MPFLERVARYVAMQARFARAALDSDEPGVSRFIYEPGSRVPFGHRHREQEEAYVVVSGSGRVKLDDEIVGLAEWDVLRVAPCVLRAFEAGPDGLDVICIGLGNRQAATVNTSPTSGTEHQPAQLRSRATSEHRSRCLPRV